MSTTEPPFPLTLIEQRVLGVLIEKQKTTPDVYPMTINGLVTGCNQKSNRDPVLNLSDAEIEECLEGMHRKQLVVRVQSGRADKWRHVLYEMWQVEKVELAVLAELFLRGPQTEGELRTRVSRMDPVDDLDAMRAIVQKLAQRKFAAYLTAEGRRGTVVGHGFVEPEVLEQWRVRHAEGARLDSHPVAGRAVSPGLPTVAAGTEELQRELADLRKHCAELRSSVDALARQVTTICEQLGLSPPTPPPA